MNKLKEKIKTKREKKIHFLTLEELALKSPQTLALPSKKPKVMSNYPFLNNWKCFSEGENGWATNVCICNLATQHLGKILWEKFIDFLGNHSGQNSRKNHHIWNIVYAGDNQKCINSIKLVRWRFWQKFDFFSKWNFQKSPNLLRKIVS